MAPQRHNSNPKRGRVYVHLRCGQPTVITKGDYIGICNPFAGGRGTYCAPCGRPDSLDQFVWADTGETIQDYRQRLREHAPAIYRWIAFPNSLIFGAFAGAALMAFSPNNKNALVLVPFGFVVGSLLTFVVCMEFLEFACRGYHKFK